jgi:dihydroflavonol-4-reductase
MKGMDYVFHAAANFPRDYNPRKVPQFVNDSAEQMKRVIRATREAKIKRLIYTSSITTIGLPPAGSDRLADERDFYQLGTMPMNGYYESKSVMENLVFDAVGVGYDIVILNPTLVLGPGDSHLSSSEVLVMIAQGKAKAAPPGIVNIIDARDAARAHVHAARIGKPGERYILGGDNYPILEAIKILADIAGVKPPSRTLPSSLIDLYIKSSDLIPFIPHAPYHLKAYHYWQGYNTEKARSVLDLKTRMLELTARDSISWFVNQGVL